MTQIVNEIPYTDLEVVIRKLHRLGEPEDFTVDGLPKVSVVNFWYSGTATRDQIDDMWYRLYGFETSRLQGD